MQRRSGIALFNVLMFASITTIMLVAGIQFTTASLKEGRTAGFELQAYQVARAGIDHAVMWLQVHRAETPTSFDPRVVPLEPDILPETTVADEQLGIVREYELDIDKKLWARYEVARSRNAPARDALTAGPSSALYTTPPTWTVDDAGLARGSTSGSVWRARAKGYVWNRVNPTDPFALTPKPLKSLTLEGEIKNLGFRVPRAAVYCFKDGTDAGATHVTFSYAGTSSAGNTEISSGGDTGVRHVWTNTAAGKVSKAGNVVWSGSGGYLAATDCTTAGSTYVEPDLTSQIRSVFGVANSDGIEGLADNSYTLATELTSPMTGMEFIYLNPGGNRGSVTFNGTTRLRGSGALFVDGSLVIDGTSASQYWNGLIFVTGHYTQTGNTTVTGAIMAGETVSIGGTGDSEKAKVIYSQDLLNRVADRFSGFRVDRSTLKIVNDNPTTF